MSNTDTNNAPNTDAATDAAAQAAAASHAASQASETNGEEQETEAEEEQFSNDQRLNEVFKQAGKFGREAGQGVDALPKLGIVMVTASMDGVFSDADGKDIDKEIVRKIYKRFVRDFGKKRQHDQSVDSENTQVAKLNVFKKLGAQKEFNGEDIMSRIIELYKELAGTTKPKSVYDAYVSAGRVAVKSAKQKATPTDEELKSAMVKAERKTKQLADIVRSIHDALDNLITGNRKDDVSCDAQEVVDARNSLKAWLTLAQRELDLERVEAEMIRLGLTKH